MEFDVKIKHKEHKFTNVLNNKDIKVLVDIDYSIVLYRFETNEDKDSYFVIYSTKEYINDYLKNEIPIRDLIIVSDTFVGTCGMDYIFNDLSIFKFRKYRSLDMESYLGFNYLDTL